MKEESVENHGKILSINAIKNRITISHSPIKKLGMPEMVMELPVDKVAETLRVSGRHVSVDATFVDGEEGGTVSVAKDQRASQTKCVLGCVTELVATNESTMCGIVSIEKAA